MQKEFQDKVVKFATLTSLAHNFTHLAFDTVRRTSHPTADSAAAPSDDLAVLVSAPSYPGTLIRLS